MRLFKKNRNANGKPAASAAGPVAGFWTVIRVKTCGWLPQGRSFAAFMTGVSGYEKPGKAGFFAASLSAKFFMTRGLDGPPVRMCAENPAFNCGLKKSLYTLTWQAFPYIN